MPVLPDKRSENERQDHTRKYKTGADNLGEFRHIVLVQEMVRVMAVVEVITDRLGEGREDGADVEERAALWKEVSENNSHRSRSTHVTQRTRQEHELTENRRTTPVHHPRLYLPDPLVVPLPRSCATPYVAIAPVGAAAEKMRRRRRTCAGLRWREMSMVANPNAAGPLCTMTARKTTIDSLAFPVRLDAPMAIPSAAPWMTSPRVALSPWAAACVSHSSVSFGSIGWLGSSSGSTSASCGGCGARFSTLGRVSAKFGSGIGEPEGEERAACASTECSDSMLRVGSNVR
jgi:hypothetical protein